jgi:hypothetical protein
MAEAICGICTKPIGYDTRFYDGNCEPPTLYHALCEEKRIEAREAAAI